MLLKFLVIFNFVNYGLSQFVVFPSQKIDGVHCTEKYYFGVFFKLNWFNAVHYCRMNGMHLATIPSEKEGNIIESKLTQLGYNGFWISGNDLGEEGKFHWLGNGQPITYTNWFADEPNNGYHGNEHCVHIGNRTNENGWKWADVNCSQDYYFICEVLH